MLDDPRRYLLSDSKWRGFPFLSFAATYLNASQARTKTGTCALIQLDVFQLDEVHELGQILNQVQFPAIKSPLYIILPCPNCSNDG